MRRYGAPLFLVLLWACSISASPVHHGGGQKTCAAQCSGTNKFNYVIGKSYNYAYDIETETTMVGTMADKSAMKISAEISINVIDECEMELKVNRISLDQEVHGASDWAAKFTQYPLRFGFNDGAVTGVCPEEGDNGMGINFKKGILSQLQNTMSNLGQNSRTKEVDMNGECTVSYEVGVKNVVIKEKDVMECDEPIRVQTFLKSIPFTSNSPNQHIPLLKGTQSCEQTIANDVLDKSVCNEKYVLRPFSTDTAGATTLVTATLTSQGKGPSSAQNNDITHRGSLRHTMDHSSDPNSHDHEHPHGSLDKAKSLMVSLCATTGYAVKKETPQLFIQLVETMGHLTKDELSDFQQDSKSKCDAGEQFFNDGLLMTKTGPAFSIMETEIREGNVKSMRTDAWLSTLIFIEHPDLNMIKAVMQLLEDEESEHSIKSTLAVGSLIFSYCKTHADCADEEIVKQYQEILGNNLNECQLDFPEDNMRIREILTALKGAGNAGIEIPGLEECILGDNVPMEIRVEAMKAYRQMPCKAKTDKIYRLMKNIDVDPELRIAAFSMVIKCPCPMCIEHCSNLLANEKSHQVKSFIVSYLRTIVGSSNPIHQGVKELLSGIDLSEEKDSTSRGHSRFMDLSSYNEHYNLGADAQVQFAYSPESFLPRSGSLNLTIELFGRAINLFEFGGNVNGFDKSVINLFKGEAISGALSNIREADADPFAEYLEGNPRATYYMRMFGQEIFFNDWYIDKADEDISEGPNIIEILGKLAKFQEVDMSRNMILSNGNFHVCSITGFPVSLSLKAAANLRVKAGGKADISKIKSYSIDLEGNLEPSAAVEVNGEMTFDVGILKTGLVVSSSIYTSTAGGISAKVTKGKAFEINVKSPQQNQEIISVSSNFYLLKSGVREKAAISADSNDYQACSHSSIIDKLGTALCTKVKYPVSNDDSPWYPFNGPMSADIYLEKRDVFDSYTLEGSLALAKKPGKPDNMKIFFDTKGSNTNRKVKVIGKLLRDQHKVILNVVAPNFDGGITFDGEYGGDVSGIKSFAVTYKKKKILDVKALVTDKQNSVSGDFEVDFPKLGFKPMTFKFNFEDNNDAGSLSAEMGSKWLELDMGVDMARGKVQEVNSHLKYKCEDDSEWTSFEQKLKYGETAPKTTVLKASVKFGTESKDKFYFDIDETSVSTQNTYEQTATTIFKCPALDVDMVETYTFTYGPNAVTFVLDDTTNGDRTTVDFKVEVVNRSPFQGTVNLELSMPALDLNNLQMSGEIKPKRDDRDHYEMSLTASGGGRNNDYSLGGSLRFKNSPYILTASVKTPQIRQAYTLESRLDTTQNGFLFDIKTQTREPMAASLKFDLNKNDQLNDADIKLELDYSVREDQWKATLESAWSPEFVSVKVFSNYGMEVNTGLRLSIVPTNPALNFDASWEGSFVEVVFDVKHDGKSINSPKRELSGELTIKSGGFEDIDFNSNFLYTRHRDNIDASGLVSWSNNEKIDFKVLVDSAGPTDKSINILINSPFEISVINVKVMYKLSDNKLETNAEVNFDDNRVGVTFNGELINNGDEQFKLDTILVLETSYYGYERIGLQALFDMEAKEQHTFLHNINSNMEVFWGQAKNEKFHFDLNFAQDGHMTGDYKATRQINLQLPLEDLTDLLMNWSLESQPGVKVLFAGSVKALNNDAVLVDSKAAVDYSSLQDPEKLEASLSFVFEKDLTSLENFDIALNYNNKNTGEMNGDFTVTWNTDSKIEVEVAIIVNRKFEFKLKTPFDSFKLLSAEVEQTANAVSFNAQTVLDANKKVMISGDLSKNGPAVSGTLTLNTPFKGYRVLKVIPELNIEDGNYFGTVTLELPAKKTIQVYTKYATRGKTELALKITTPSGKEFLIEMEVSKFTPKAVEGFIKFQDVVVDVVYTKTDDDNVKWSLIGERNKKKVIVKGGRSKVSTPEEDTYERQLVFKHPASKIDTTLKTSLVKATDGSKISAGIDVNYITNAKKKQSKTYKMNVDILPYENEIRYSSDMPYGETSLTGRYEDSPNGQVVKISGSIGEWPVAGNFKVNDDGISGLFEYTDEKLGFHSKLVTPYNIETKFYFSKGDDEVVAFVLGGLVKSDHVIEVYNHVPDDFIPTLKGEFNRVKAAVKAKMAVHVKKLGLEFKKKKFVYTKLIKSVYVSPQFYLVKYIGDKTAARRKQLMAEIKKQMAVIKKQTTAAIASIKPPFPSYSAFMNSMKRQVTGGIEDAKEFIEDVKSKIQGMLDSSSETSIARYLANAISDGKEDNLIIALRNEWKQAVQEIKDYFESLDKDVDYILENTPNEYLANNLRDFRKQMKELLEESDIENRIKIPVFSFVQDLISQGDESTKTMDKFHEMLKNYIKPENSAITNWDQKSGKYAAELYSPIAFDDFESIPDKVKNYVNKRIEPIRKRFDEMSRNFENLKKSIKEFKYNHKADIYDSLRQPSGVAKIEGGVVTTFDGADLNIDDNCMFTLVRVVEPSDDASNFELSLNAGTIQLQSGGDLVQLRHRHGEDPQIILNDVDVNPYNVDDLFAGKDVGASFDDMPCIHSKNMDLMVMCGQHGCRVSLKSWYFNNVEGVLGNFNSESHDDLDIGHHEVGCSI